jgi:ribosomal subunit interface protein
MRSAKARPKFMQLPVNITYRGVVKSDDIDQFVLEKAARLEKFCDHINRCDVAIEQPNHAHQKGNPFRVRIDVTVPPGHELVSDEQGVDNGSYAPLTKVIHDAFKTMERELRRVVEKQRHEVKTHADSRSPK